MNIKALQAHFHLRYSVAVWHEHPYNLQEQSWLQSQLGVLKRHLQRPFDLEEQIHKPKVFLLGQPELLER